MSQPGDLGKHRYNKGMRKNFTKHVLASLAASTALAIALPAAASAATTVDVDGQATLLAKGAGVTVTFDVSCDVADAQSTAFSFVLLTQNIGSAVTHGEGNTRIPVNCDGAPNPAQIVTKVVQTSFRAFKKGPALAEVHVDVCNFDNTICDNAVVHEVVQLVQ